MASEQDERGEDELPEEQMTAAAFEHVFPWTEEEFFALGETTDRVELFDGSLLVSPAPTFGHQRLSVRLATALDGPAQPVGLEVALAVNVRLGAGRVATPDLVIGKPQPPDTVYADAADIRLICEITSTNAAADRVMKMHYYAVAGIEWYLLVDPKPITLSLFKLDEDRYVPHATAEAGSVLRLTEPIAVDLVPDRLLT